MRQDLRDESAIVTAGQSVLIPAGARHGFRNVGTGILRVRATLDAAIFEASYDDRSELSRRYVPNERDHGRRRVDLEPASPILF